MARPVPVYMEVTPPGSVVSVALLFELLAQCLSKLLKRNFHPLSGFRNLYAEIIDVIILFIT